MTSKEQQREGSVIFVSLFKTYTLTTLRLHYLRPKFWRALRHLRRGFLDNSNTDIEHHSDFPDAGTQEGLFKNHQLCQRLKEKNNRLLRTVISVRKDKDNLTEQLSQSEDHTKQYAVLRKEKLDLQDKKSNLTEQLLKQDEECTKQSAILRKENFDPNDKNDNLTEQLSQQSEYHTEHFAILRKENLNLQDKNNKLTEQLFKQNKELTERSAKLQEKDLGLQVKNDETTEVRSALLQEQGASQKTDQLRSDLHRFQYNSTERKRKLQKLERHIMALETRVDELADFRQRYVEQVRNLAIETRRGELEKGWCGC